MIRTFDPITKNPHFQTKNKSIKNEHYCRLYIDMLDSAAYET